MVIWTHVHTDTILFISFSDMPSMLNCDVLIDHDYSVIFYNIKIYFEFCLWTRLYS